jgi:2-methylisocitrate lyase-like PEP mutase family enzyme
VTSTHPSAGDIAARRARFAGLHAADELFVIPNPWDVGSARLLEAMGFSALATTSSGMANAIGRHDQQVTRDELVAHVAALVAATTIPVHVDSEACFPGQPGGITMTVRLLAEAGAAGCSIEDFDPTTGPTVLPLDVATERVAEAAAAAHAPATPMLLTARAENHLYGVGDLDDTIARLIAYRDAGADVVYAPGLADIGDITRVVDEVGVPVNVLARTSVPPLGTLAAAGVRRVSTGGLLAQVAYGAMVRAAQDLADGDTATYAQGTLDGKLRGRAFS